ncbi:S53 family peptidase [Hamadaea tsunoensis]|uniref:S53 family peptidase n=1 Tax=Hamadaea tsunoensis TaxID=53368 RepID=UPI000402F6C4|nr:S53 family peptidase [Hamadaea tsunoensis]
MRTSLRTLAVTGALLIAAAVTAVSAPAAAAPSDNGLAHRSVKVCATATADTAACHAWVRTDVAPAAVPSGFGPADLRSAYNLTTSGSSATTVAVVDAYDAPTAEADLAAYRTQFGLPACTTANGCFRKIDQNGGTSYPRKNTGWAQEISLDLDMVSAICPNCKILLVEAKTNSFANLGTAENQAVAQGARIVSNSWGGSDAADSTYGAYFNHPGVAITVSSGDNGYGVEYPASSHYVTAVGGTHLVAGGGSRGWTETVWSGAGSGCSTLNTALSGQAGFGTGCAGRAEADVAAVADPNTGVAVRYNGSWLVFGGTSVAAPIIAGVYGLAGNAASIDNNYPYTHSGSLYDITSGSNGSCPTSQWCTARAGWDGPTGLGTPNGTGAF